MRCFKFECFSRAMIELIHYRLNLVVSYVLKTATFGKVLFNQTLGKFVLHLLPLAASSARVFRHLQVIKNQPRILN